MSLFLTTLDKTKDITNVELNPDAIQFSDISTETYLEIPNNASTPIQDHSTSTISSTIQSTTTTSSTGYSDINASETIQDNPNENIFDGDVILNDLNQVDTNSIVVELPNDLEDINETDIILLVTQ